MSIAPILVKTHTGSTILVRGDAGTVGEVKELVDAGAFSQPSAYTLWDGGASSETTIPSRARCSTIKAPSPRYLKPSRDWA